MSPLWQLLLVSTLVMGIAHTITKERIFKPLRDRLGGKETWAGYFVSCPYCVSHWVAFLVVPLTGTYLIEVPFELGVVTPLLEWFFSSVLVAVIAAFLRVGFYFIDETQGLVRRRQRYVEDAAKELESELEEHLHRHQVHEQGFGDGRRFLEDERPAGN